MMNSSRIKSPLLHMLAGVLSVLFLLPSAALGQEAQHVKEAELKAAFVFNFAVFTEWPADVLQGAAILHLCAFSGNNMQAALSALSDKVVNGHRMRFRPLGISGNASGCHILVLDAQDRERWPQLRKELGASSVLTVADDRAIGTSGAMIALGMDNKRIGFDVDLTAARQAGLNLSSKLLHLARSVQ